MSLIIESAIICVSRHSLTICSLQREVSGRIFYSLTLITKNMPAKKKAVKKTVKKTVKKAVKKTAKKVVKKATKKVVKKAAKKTAAKRK